MSPLSIASSWWIRGTIARSTLIFTCALLLGVPLAQAQSPWRWDGVSWADYRPFMSLITPDVKAHLQSIKLRGEAHQRIVGRLGQIGDSITYSSAYLRNVLGGGANPNETQHDYSAIRSWIAYGGSKPADFNSFYRDSGKGELYGNMSGWTLQDAQAAGHPAQAVEVGDGATPGNFSWVLIMFGSNDIDRGGWDAEEWSANLRQFVEEFIDLGIIPVLSTIPPELAHVGDGRVESANDRIRALAKNLDIPYVDYYALIRHYQPVDWVGTLISNDGTHPSAGGGGQDFSKVGLTMNSGYSARSKLTFDMAEKLRVIVFEDGPSEPQD